MFGYAESEHPWLTKGEIISEEFQPSTLNSSIVSYRTYVITIHQRHRRTDDMRSQDRALHSSASRGKK